MHRLVQQVIRDNLNNQKDWAETSVNALNATFPNPNDFSNWRLCQDLLPNVQTVFSLVNQYDLKTEKTGRLCNEAGLYLNKTGQYGEVEAFYKRALSAGKNSFGEKDICIAIYLNNLAALYYNQGRYEEAKPLYKDSLKMRKKLLGEEHPDVATSLNNLGILYANKRDYEQSGKYLAKVLELLVSMFGPEHPDSITMKKFWSECGNR